MKTIDLCIILSHLYFFGALILMNAVFILIMCGFILGTYSLFLLINREKELERLEFELKNVKRRAKR